MLLEKVRGMYSIFLTMYIAFDQCYIASIDIVEYTQVAYLMFWYRRLQITLQLLFLFY